MKKIIIVAIISAFALMLGGCSSKNESGVEISKGPIPPRSDWRVFYRIFFFSRPPNTKAVKKITLLLEVLRSKICASDFLSF